MNSTRRLRTLGALGIAALAASSVAFAAGGVAGRYATTIKSPAQLKGKWSLTLANGGSYTVAVNGETVARGRYSATPKTITLFREQGSGCTGAGTYAWTRSGMSMTFVKRRESASCQARAVVLSHRFTRVR